MADGNGSIGIALNTSSGNIVTDNRTKQNGAGDINLFRSSDNTIANNQSNNNTLHGFYVLAGTNNTLAENEALQNRGHGFEVADYQEDGVIYYSEDNKIVLNHACRNEWVDGFDNSSGTGNVWIDNDFCTFYDVDPF